MKLHALARSASRFALALSIGLGGCQPPPSESSSPEAVSPSTEADVTTALNDFLRRNDDAPEAIAYKAAYHDLDGDGLNDALVLLQGPNWCSLSGCALLTFRGAGPQSFIFVSKTERIREPILLSATRTNSWRDLVVSTVIRERPEDVMLTIGPQGYPADATAGKIINRLELKADAVSF
ncbi:MAG: hypothetical protein HC824_08735 [Synechococcales cyanobacterium RM1_1_8]|nr:hypothetical protein [Synechococcales cyanobacterium RM1_1_8]